ncbi:uncharacterized protein E6C27_scaffold2406G00070 [Cucumis melo var. makuwa]|uniref:CACTA en-spm transposon protein n=1 Tax=Cucumis melo var. makuwa TaxID=1194695 RepID=A0A5A7V3P0_CUCMM|nr:uncharacterized protein E6C27_scaffold2406G00070 [Cucumis melo var. makuwa]
MKKLKKLSAATTRKWSIPDAEKDVGIKNVGNKSFPDVVNNASGDAIETERGKKRTSRDRRRDFRRPSAAVPPPSVAALPRRCPSPPSATLEVEDVQNNHINILEVVVSHQVDDHIEDDTLCRNDVDPTIVERPVVRHVIDDFIDDVDEHLSHASDEEL